jgi:hypothetical protein
MADRGAGIDTKLSRSAKVRQSEDPRRALYHPAVNSLKRFAMPV